MNFMEKVLSYFGIKPKMEIQLDTGWMDYDEYTSNHWIDKFRNSNYFKTVTDDDGWTIKSSYFKYDYLIPQNMRDLISWGGWRIFLLRGSEKIVMFKASEEGLTIYPDYRTRIVVFSNSDNFWTCFMLKYR